MEVSAASVGRLHAIFPLAGSGKARGRGRILSTKVATVEKKKAARVTTARPSDGK